MNRLSALAFATVAVLGVAFVSGTSVSPGSAKSSDEKKAEGEKPVGAVGPKVAVFNMPAVMRDFGQAKYKVWLLNKQKTEMSKQLMAWRADYTEHQQDLQMNPQHPRKEVKQKAMQRLAQMIEEEDRRINEQLNDDASAIISELYDKMKAVVDKTAELNGYHVVFSYPDAVTPEEMKSAYAKELKLKPPAAQPFYVDPKADITATVVKTLNIWFPPLDAKTGQPVDVSKLEVPPVPPVQNSSKIQLPPGMIPLG